jgi:hypothetical protein
MIQISPDGPERQLPVIRARLKYKGDIFSYVDRFRRGWDVFCVYPAEEVDI